MTPAAASAAVSAASSHTDAGARGRRVGIGSLQGAGPAAMRGVGRGAAPRAGLTAAGPGPRSVGAVASAMRLRRTPAAGRARPSRRRPTAAAAAAGPTRPDAEPAPTPAPLHAAGPTWTYRVRDAEEGPEWWSAAAVHCDCFYPTAARTPLRPLLKFDRVLGLAQGVANVRGGRGPTACLVAVREGGGGEGAAAAADRRAALPFLLRWLPDDALGSVLDDPSSPVIGVVVADAQGGRLPPRAVRVVGGTRAVDRPGVGYVSNLCVAEDARGRGVAAALLAAAEARLFAEWGCRFACLHAAPANAPAAALYARAGYRIVAPAGRSLGGGWGGGGRGLELYMKPRSLRAAARAVGG